MASAALRIGYPVPIVQNTVYALPARRVMLFSDATTPTFQQSTTEAFTANASITLTNGQAELCGGFLRCTSATPGNIILKPTGS